MLAHLKRRSLFSTVSKTRQIPVFQVFHIQCSEDTQLVDASVIDCYASSMMHLETDDRLMHNLRLDQCALDAREAVSKFC